MSRTFILTATVEISDQRGTSETRIIGAFDTQAHAEIIRERVERMFPARRTTSKITQVEMNAAADWGNA